MNKNEILKIYDENRKNPGPNWEATEFFTRQTGFAGEGIIYYSCFPEEKLDEGIQEQIQHFSNLGEEFEWKVFDQDTPKNLREKLVQHGFVLGDKEAFIVMDLNQFSENQTSIPSDVEVKRVENQKMLQDYGKVELAVHGSGIRESIKKQLEGEPEKISIYVAYIDGQPVSVGRTDFADEHPKFAGFFGGATLPEFRRRGTYKALVAARIQEAKKRGYLYAYVDALPTSEPILRKLGFEKVSNSTPMVWSPPQDKS